MTHDFPLTRDLVLIGGGHTHALVLRNWGMDPLPGVRLTVINPGPTAPYSGMLPGFVAGHYTRDELDIDLVRLCRFAGARLISGAAVGLNPSAKQIEIPGRPPVAYDVVSIDIGITSEMPSLAGFLDHGVPAKPLGPFASHWDRYRTITKDPGIAVIGGGVAGAELAMAMAYALRDQDPIVTLIDRGRVLDGFNPPARSRLMGAFSELGVICVEHADVVEVSADAVVLADGQRIASTFTTGAAGAKPHAWLSEIGLDHLDGFLTVGKTLQTSDPDIFAVGDCAHLSHAPRPKAGVFAVREAPVLFANLRAHLMDRPLAAFWPQKDYLKLISLGGQVALAEKFGSARRGAVLWRWKDWIDRKFMTQFDDLSMPDVKPPRDRAAGGAVLDGMMCAGCGSKVGRHALQRAVAAHRGAVRPDVTDLPGDDAALLRTGGATQVLSTDHLNAVTEDPVLMARIATNHALGDIWAMAAAPQAATLSLTLPRMSTALQERWVTEVTSTVSEVLSLAGAALVGGHTSQGRDFVIGLSVTGLCETEPVTLTGAQPGDALILTKPIGSGVILAAHMRATAPGRDVLACFDVMVQSQARAAHHLSRAHAMTDVTGFGLSGHLEGLCTASGVGAEVALDDVPLMQGALTLATKGMRSSLFADNRNDCAADAPDGALADLMFDPQTSGGLLAAVPAAQATAVTAALRSDGYEAAVIGRIVSTPGLTFHGS